MTDPTKKDRVVEAFKKYDETVSAALDEVKQALSDLTLRDVFEMVVEALHQSSEDTEDDPQ